MNLKWRNIFFLHSSYENAPVASIAHLIALKVLARDDRTRPQDRLDLAGLFRKPPSMTRHSPRGPFAHRRNAATAAVGTLSTTSRKLSAS